MKLSNTPLLALFTLLVLSPNICYASGTMNEYVALGWIVSIFTWSFFLIFWWLFDKVRGLNAISISIFMFSVLCIAPFGISYIQNGAVLPNWYIYIEQKNIGVSGTLSNAVILLVNSFVFISTRKQKKQAT